MGVDLISSRKKVCSFDCVYCQLGRGGISSKTRKVFVPVGRIIREFKSLPSLKIDFITFSGMGEPTLAANLGKVIKAVKKIRKEKIAVLTNASLLWRKDVQRDLMPADFVEIKLDAGSQKSLGMINNPQPALKFNRIIKGIKDFRKKFNGVMALQIMFVEDNKKDVQKIASIARGLRADVIHINTPLRPCGVKPLSKKEIKMISGYFKDALGRFIKVASVYEARKKKVYAVNSTDMLKRRGKPE